MPRGDGGRGTPLRHSRDPFHTAPAAVSLEVREVSVLWSAGTRPRRKSDTKGRRDRRLAPSCGRCAQPQRTLQQPSRHRKIVVRSKRDGCGKLRVCGTGCTRQQRSAPPREYLLVFKDIDMKRAEESSALIGERTSSTPLNFALGTAQRRPNCRARIGGAAGYGPDKQLAVTVSTRNTAPYRDPAVILIDQLKQIYIDGELEPVDTTQWYPR